MISISTVNLVLKSIDKYLYLATFQRNPGQAPMLCMAFQVPFLSPFMDVVDKEL